MPVFAVLVGIGLLILAYGWFVEPYLLRVSRQRVEVAKPRFKEPLRILFVSDIHIGIFSRTHVLTVKLARLRALHAAQPYDLILLGGDFLDRSLAYLPRLQDFLKGLTSLGLPTYAVLGNHDYMAGRERMEELIAGLGESGVKVLRNDAVLFKKKGSELVVVGVDDLETSPAYFNEKEFVHFSAYSKRLTNLDWYSRFDGHEPEAARLLLGHNPDVVYLKGDHRPDVTIAGHTHGGQVLFVDWLSRPLYRFFGHHVPAGSFVTWAGRRLINGTVLIVSRGLEGSLLPLRFFRRPDVVELVLEPANLPKTLIVGLSGKPRVGKDTVANMLQTLFPGIRRAAFANAIKEEYDAIHGTNTLGNEEEKQKHRMGLHEMGAAGRAKDPDYWVKKALQHEPPLLITDVRLPQEARAVREAGGWLVRVESSEATMRERLKEYYDEHANHENERWLDSHRDWDFVIHNNGSLEQLEARVLQIARHIRTVESRRTAGNK